MPLPAVDKELARRSYYNATARRDPSWPALHGGADCDVAVVGGGLAGLTAALELADRGLAVTLLEAHEIGFGASGRSAGVVLPGLACGEKVIEGQLGLQDARRIWDLSVQALDMLRDRIQRHTIACDWQDGHLRLATSSRQAAVLTAWADRIGGLYGYPLQRIARADIGGWVASERFHRGVHDARSGHLHPLKYTLGLAHGASLAGVRLHEHCAVQALEHEHRPGHEPGLRLRTANGTLHARQVLLAGNVYLASTAPGLAPALARRITPVVAGLACTERLPADVAAALIPSRASLGDSGDVTDCFRLTADDRLLCGSTAGLGARPPRDLDKHMQQRMLGSFPQLAGTELEYVWGGYADVSLNRAPDFGRLPAAKKGQPQNIYYLQGFAGHGLALSGLAGRLVAEAMAGDSARFDVFTRLRHRRFPGPALLRSPALALATAWQRLRDMLG